MEYTVKMRKPPKNYAKVQALYMLQGDIPSMEKMTPAPQALNNANNKDGEVKVTHREYFEIKKDKIEQKIRRKEINRNEIESNKRTAKQAEPNLLYRNGDN